MLATGIAPSEYELLDQFEIAAFVEIVNERSR